jgi:hypothetical protein
VQTVPGKGWHLLANLYGPREPFSDKTGRPEEFEEIIGQKTRPQAEAQAVRPQSVQWPTGRPYAPPEIPNPCPVT